MGKTRDKVKKDKELVMQQHLAQRKSDTEKLTKRLSFFERIGIRLLVLFDELTLKYSLVGSGNFFDPNLFPEVRELEKNFPVIKSELESILKKNGSLPAYGQISPVELTHERRWKIYGLRIGEQCDPTACQEVPKTMEVLKSLSSLTGLTMFSVLEPGAVILPHTGFSRGGLRVHLPLIVPREKERCRIRVLGEWRHWEEGKCLVFDDVWLHEVRNDTDEIRVVLFTDIFRPLPWFLSIINRSIYGIATRSRLMQEAAGNMKKWHKDNKKTSLAESDNRTVDGKTVTVRLATIFFLGLVAPISFIGALSAVKYSTTFFLFASMCLMSSLSGVKIIKSDNSSASLKAFAAGVGTGLVCCHSFFRFPKGVPVSEDIGLDARQEYNPGLSLSRS